MSRHDEPAGPRPERQPDARIPELDGLRGLAILAVMLHHFTLYGEMKPLRLVGEVYQRVTLTGWCGVDLFFVLSGFLITGILYDARGNERALRNFYIRRVLRIFPLYYAALVVAFLAVPALFRLGDAYREVLGEQGWYWSYLINVRIAFDGWPEFTALGHFWSLAVEEQFYLIWPLLVLNLSRGAMIRVSVGCILAAPVVRWVLCSTVEPVAAFVLTPARADALAVGALIALVARSPRGLEPLRRGAATVAAVSGGLVVAWFLWRRELDSEHPWVATAGLSLLALAFGGVLVRTLVAPASSRASRVLRDARLRALGRYSYGLYVVHHPVAIGLAAAGFSVADLPGAFSSRLPGQLVFTTVATVLSLAIAIPSWHLFENPILNLKRHFPR